MRRDEKKLYEAAFDQVGRRVFELLAPTPEMLPIEHALLDKRLKKATFTSSAPVISLGLAASAQVAQGNADRVIESAELLRAFPYTGDTDMWSGPNAVQYMGVRLLRRAGDDAAADELQPYLFKDKNAGAPGDMVLTPALDRIRRGQLLRRVWRGVPETHIYDRVQQLNWLYAAIGTLSKMWVLNDEDVTEWSRAEIEEEIECNIAFIPVLDVLKGQERPPHLTLDAQDGRPGSGDGAAPR